MAPSIARARAELIGDALRQFGDVRVRVTGSSMLPSIFPGDVLTIRRRMMREVRRGDVAVFARAGRLFAHRVVAHNGDHLVTRGESVPSTDAPVTHAELLGIAVLLERAGKAQIVSSHVGLAARLTAAVVRRSSRASALLQRVRGRQGAIPDGVVS